MRATNCMAPEMPFELMGGAPLWCRYLQTARSSGAELASPSSPSRLFPYVAGQAIITTVAGTTTTAGVSGDGEPATSAELNLPSDVAVDTSGTMYIVDYGNNRVRRVSAAGIITTVAGNGASGSTGDGGAAIAASLNGPVAIAVDHNGNLFIAERYRVRKVSPAGAITTYAGGASLTTDGVATNTYMQPAGVAVDSAGVLYIADKSYGIRKVSTGGIITTIIGGRFGFSGDGGAATRAMLNAPTGVTVDGTGNIYFVDSGNNRIRKINSSGLISTVVGTGTQGFSGDGGPATSAKIGSSIVSPHQGLATDSSGNLISLTSQTTGSAELTSKESLRRSPATGSLLSIWAIVGYPPTPALDLL